MTNQFYRSIACHYDDIFPLNPAQLSFVSNRLSQGGTVLDIGCASGELSLALAGRGHRVVGVDLDGDLLNIARDKATQRKVPVDWHQRDMTKLDVDFAGVHFDGILCVGNTLVHLSSEEAIGGFLKSARAHLKGAAPLVVQIINYNRIMEGSVRTLPLIDNQSVRFERSYNTREDGALDFETRLYVKSTGELLENTVRLLPIQKNTMHELLKAAGFAKVEYFGSFKGEPFEEQTSYALVSVAV